MSALLELLKKKKQDINASKSRKTLKLADGRGRYRVLPSWRGESQQFWHDFGQHFIKDAKGVMQAVYICADRTFGKPCAVCDAVRAAIKQETDDGTMKALTEATSSGRILLNVLHLDGPTPEEVQVLEAPGTVFEQILNIASEYEEAGESILSLAAGKDLIIERTGKGKQTKYTVLPAVKSAVFDVSILKKLNDLDAFVAQESSDQETRALNSVRAVAGLLPAPAAAKTSGLPLAAAAGAVIVEDEDAYAVAAPPKRAAPAAVIEDAVMAKAPAPAPTPVAAATPAPSPISGDPVAVVGAADSSTGDPDLDAMLAEIG